MLSHRVAVSHGSANLLTQRFVRDVGHCSFTSAEVNTAFDDLVSWVERGVKPAGDELIDASSWNRPDAGCAHTDNTVGPEDRANAVQRASIQAAYPACPLAH